MDFYKVNMPVTYREGLKADIMARTVMYGPDGCWIWSGTVNRDGYGYVKRKHWGRENRINIRVHRFMYFVESNANLTDAISLSHLCNVKTCINPAHIVEEPLAINLQRRTCFSAGHCFNHLNYPPCRIP